MNENETIIRLSSKDVIIFTDYLMTLLCKPSLFKGIGNTPCSHDKKGPMLTSVNLHKIERFYIDEVTQKVTKNVTDDGQ